MNSNTHSVTAAVRAGVRLTRGPVPPLTAVCDAGHEALTEGVRETPHHLPHALMMDLEWVAKEGMKMNETCMTVTLMSRDRLIGLALFGRVNRVSCINLCVFTTVLSN